MPLSFKQLSVGWPGFSIIINVFVVFCFQIWKFRAPLLSEVLNPCLQFNIWLWNFATGLLPLTSMRCSNLPAPKEQFMGFSGATVADVHIANKSQLLERSKGKIGKMVLVKVYKSNAANTSAPSGTTFASKAIHLKRLSWKIWKPKEIPIPELEAGLESSDSGIYHLIFIAGHHKRWYSSGILQIVAI